LSSVAQLNIENAVSTGFFFIKADRFDMKVLSSIWDFLPAIASVAQNITVFVTYHKHP